MVPTIFARLTDFSRLYGDVPDVFLCRSLCYRENKYKQVACYLLGPNSQRGRFDRAYFSTIIADKTGVLNMQVVWALISAAFCFCWIRVQSTAVLIAVYILFAFFSAAYIPLPGPALISITHEVSRLGTRMGYRLAASEVGFLLGNPLGGIILGDTDNWLGLQAFSAAILRISVLAARVAKARSTPWAKA